MSSIVPVVTKTFGAAPELAERIIAGLESGEYTRWGGVIRNTSNGRFVTFLRDLGSTISPLPNTFGPLLQLNAAVSAVNLSITAVGFGLVLHRLSVIEHKLASIAAVMQSIDRKIDLSFYANFRAALELARSAMSMTGDTNRKASASQAINRFLEAEQHYISLFDRDMNDGAWAASQFLSTLSLAFVSVSQCYLEMGEPEIARRHLSEAEVMLAPRVQRFSEAFVGPNAAIYLHPKLAQAIDLQRFTRLQRQEHPGQKEAQVFEQLRESIWRTARQEPDAWLKTLPKSLWNHEADGMKKIGPVRIRQSSEEMLDRLLLRLPDAFDQVEQAYESINCLRGYGAELQFLHESGVSLDAWARMETPRINADDRLACLVPHDSELLRPTGTQPALVQRELMEPIA